MMTCSVPCSYVPLDKTVTARITLSGRVSIAQKSFAGFEKIHKSIVTRSLKFGCSWETLGSPWAGTRSSLSGKNSTSDSLDSFVSNSVNEASRLPVARSLDGGVVGETSGAEADVLVLDSRPLEHDPYWQEYKAAVQQQDLGQAFSMLRKVRSGSSVAELDSPPFLFESDTETGVPPKRGAPGSRILGDQDEESGSIVPHVVPDIVSTAFVSEEQEEMLKILDAALNEEDMDLVASTYQWLQNQGILRAFGKYKLSNSEEPRVVTPALFKASAGIDASKLSPQKWDSGGGWKTVAVIAAFSFLVNNGVDVRPVAFVLMGLAILDAMYLGGTLYGQVLSLWPAYKERVLVHEAGHVVSAYLLGCPVRGVVLDAKQAVKMGIQGQAGTQFWDSKLEAELKQGRLSSSTLDRYHVVLFSGIAAEALVYGQAEGGESDENMFKALISELRPSWSLPKMSNQARWAVLQAYQLLKEHRKVLEAVVGVLKGGGGMGAVAKVVEDMAGVY